MVIIDCQTFQDYYAKASPNDPEIDNSKVEIRVWKDPHGYTYTGMRHSDT